MYIKFLFKFGFVHIQFLFIFHVCILLIHLTPAIYDPRFLRICLFTRHFWGRLQADFLRFSENSEKKCDFFVRSLAILTENGRRCNFSWRKALQQAISLMYLRFWANFRYFFSIYEFAFYEECPDSFPRKKRGSSVYPKNSFLVQKQNLTNFTLIINCYWKI